MDLFIQPEANTGPVFSAGPACRIAYQQEMALLLSACVTIVVVVSLGHSMSQTLVWSATVAGAILVLQQVRTRSKLLMGVVGTDDPDGLPSRTRYSVVQAYSAGERPCALVAARRATGIT